MTFVTSIACRSGEAGGTRAPSVVAETHPQGDHEAHAVFGPVREVPLSRADQRRLDRQWAEAADAAETLREVKAIRAAGYVQASTQNPGVGAHWIDWSLVGEPFDPSRPAMLLLDHGSDPPRLMGFSYWVGGTTAPEGFAGPNDHWHRHRGLCFVEGWLDREDVVAGNECDGQWVDGRNLWMLHAWVVPDAPNRWGRFAPTHPDLCPLWYKVPDILSCQPA